MCDQRERPIADRSTASDGFGGAGPNPICGSAVRDMVVSRSSDANGIGAPALETAYRRAVASSAAESSEAHIMGSTADTGFKVRLTRHGAHVFDRRRGLNVLLDEIVVPPERRH